ncbi:MAG: DUF805 domain-containing protein [Candidatus Krumholzibacteriota bacterium]
MGWYLEVLKKYAKFSGRAHRREYWMFVLINVVVSLVLAAIDYSMGSMNSAGYGLLGGIYTLAILLPTIAVSVRRLHDTNRSGMWYLLIFVPIIGPIALLFFFVQEGQGGRNQYGEISSAAA